MANSVTYKPTARRVVIVDDSSTIQVILDNAFSKRADFRVVGFSSDPRTAVEIIRRLRPDLVTIDLNMPYIDGAALLDMIRDLKTVCKIVVSDAPLKNLALSTSLLESGAALCIGKSELAASPDKFFAKINAAMAETIQRNGRHRGTAGSLVDQGQGNAGETQATGNKIFPVSLDEARRAHTVRRKGLTNSKRERQFDLITKHLAKITGFPVSLLTFMDRDTQWIKSACGLDTGSTPREEAFCNYTIAQGGAFVVANAAHDARFADFPSVTEAPSIRCYVGHPITTSDGVSIGALCVIDNRVRTVSKHVLDQLAGMSEIVSELINQRSPIAA